MRTQCTHHELRSFCVVARLNVSYFQQTHQRVDGYITCEHTLARSLLHDPDILLMDEPFSALDSLTRDEMSLELLRIWTERPKTVVFVTHSIQEALLLSDRIVVMGARPGRVTEIIDVPFERPRALETLTDPTFHQMANEMRLKLFSRNKS